MKTPKAVAFLFASLLVLGAISATAGSVMATAIGNVTEEVTTLFIDLIPLIVILGVFGLVMAAIKFRR